MSHVLECDNVVARLQKRCRDAQTYGFEVRTVLLQETEASWCEFGKRKVIFLDLAQTAAEQLDQLEEILCAAVPRAANADPLTTRRTGQRMAA